MKNLLRLEELAQFLVCVLALIISDVPWWAYVLLAIGPDIGMLGYLINTKIGAITYNALHHKGLPILIILLIAGGVHERIMMWSQDMIEWELPWPVLLAIILYGHASLDRIFGYGLKFGDSFQHTHLGWIGKGQQAQEQ